jgi:putative transposase
MHLVEGEIYHVYNRGNNKQTIFFRPQNYPYFLKGMERYVSPYCDLLAWCLMPNHFHLLIHANEKSIMMIKDGSFQRQQFSQAIKQLLSSTLKPLTNKSKEPEACFSKRQKGFV